MTKEIITIQLGNYANHVGAHWWNMQESSFSYAPGKPSDINHDVLYREGLTSRNEVTFTPRLILVDLKGSLRHVREEGELYDIPKPDVSTALWPADRVQVNVAPELPEKNSFLKDLEESSSSAAGDTASQSRETKEFDLDSEMNGWSDFLVARFHPRTVLVAKEYQHDSKTQPFDVFNYGVNMWKTEHFEEELTDRIRCYIEECDNAQGFHILVDGTDGFGGVATCLTEYVADEYQKKSMLVVPLIPPHKENITPVQECIRTINLSLALQKLAEHSSLVVPLGTDSNGWRKAGPPRVFPHLQYNPTLEYHTSAILATALDTVSLRYRLRDASCCLSDVVDPMSRSGRRVASASVNLPLPMFEDAFLMDTLETWQGSLWTSITPNCNPDMEDINQRIWMQSVGLQGVPQDRLMPPDLKKEQARGALHECKTPADLLRAFLAFSSHGTYSHVTSRDAMCKVNVPFPNIFSPSVAPSGFIYSEGCKRPKICVKEVPVLASINSCDAVGTMLSSLHAEASKLNIRRFPAYAKAGLEVDDLQESQDHLQTLIECYDEHYDF